MSGVGPCLPAGVHEREGEEGVRWLLGELHGFQLEQRGISRHQQSIKAYIEG